MRDAVITLCGISEFLPHVSLVSQAERCRQPHSNFLLLNISGSKALRAPCCPLRHLSTLVLFTARCTHANPLSPSGFSFHFPLKYESPSNIYRGPHAEKAVVSLLYPKRRKRHGPCPYKVYPLVKAGFLKIFKIITTRISIYVQ